MRRLYGTALILASVAACGPSAEPAPEGPDRVAAPAAPPTFGFGSAASPERVAAWDVDVRPDGVGLPPGEGTVGQGAQVFARNCAACHGADGTGVQGVQGGSLVGTDPWEEYPGTGAIGGYWPYATTLYDYILRAMPQNAPGSLSADETYAVIAWILNRNELVPEDAVMNATTLPAVQMPARDRFVPDDRLAGGTEIR